MYLSCFPLQIYITAVRREWTASFLCTLHLWYIICQGTKSSTFHGTDFDTQEQEWHPWPPSHHLRFHLLLPLPLLLLFLHRLSLRSYPSSTPAADPASKPQAGADPQRASGGPGESVWSGSLDEDCELCMTWALWMSSLGKNRVTGQTGPAASWRSLRRCGSPQETSADKVRASFSIYHMDKATFFATWNCWSFESQCCGLRSWTII